MSKTKRLKSVHITNYYHENSGGVKTNYDKLLAAAERHQRYIRLIVPGAENKTENISEFAKIYYVKAPRSPLFDSRYRLIMPWQYLLTNSPIRNILLAEMPDMIEIYDNYALTLFAGSIRKNYFKRLGRPMLIYFTGERLDTIIASFITGSAFGRWLSRRLMGNYNLPMFDFYIANSPFVMEELIESTDKNFDSHRSDWFFNKCWNYFKAATIPLSDRSAVCPRGVDTTFFDPKRRSSITKAKVCKDNGLPENSVILMSSTRLSLEKNIGMIVGIMRILNNDPDHDFRFILAGDGPSSEWLRKESDANFPGKLVLLGHLDKESLADHYANCDVFIHPNPREPFGNVALEAMASGVPVLVADSGGVLTYANEGNAWLSQATPEDFAKNIQTIVADTSQRNAKIKNALLTAETYSQNMAIDRLMSTYEDMHERFVTSKENFGANDNSIEINYALLNQKTA